MPPERPALNHMGIFVRNLAEMERFYVGVFGLLVTDRGSGHLIKHDLVFLSADATKHHELVLASGRENDAASTVMQISFKVRRLDDLRRISKLALEWGATQLRCLDHGNSWSIYFLDPEENTIEVYMDTPFHVPQPHAVELDLAQTDAEIEARTQQLYKQDPAFMSRESFCACMKRRLDEAS